VYTGKHPIFGNRKLGAEMITFLDIFTTVCIGLLIGTEFSVSVFINPVLRRLDEVAQARAIPMFAKRLGGVMPFWYAASLLLLIAETIIRRHEADDLLLIIASAVWAAVIILTIIFLVPINNRISQLDSLAFPADAQREHQKWDRLHRLRVVALAMAMVCCLVAIQS
jgi:uncharacterized membrane protein